VELVLTVAFALVGLLMIVHPGKKMTSYVTEKSQRAREEAERALKRDLRILGFLLIAFALVAPLLAPIVMVVGLAVTLAHAVGKAEEGAEKESIERPGEVKGIEIRPDPFFKYALVASLALCALSLVPLALYAKSLPELVVVHYDFNFKPNGWMPRTSFVLFYALTVLSLTFFTSLMSAIAYLKPETFFSKRSLVATLLLAQAASSATFLYLLLANAGRGA